MRHTQLITTAALVAACAAPTAAVAQSQDLRSPDTKDAAAAAKAGDYQDLRSPDTKDAAAAANARDYQDLRSPDSRDAGRPPVQIPTNVVTVDQPSTGFDWGDAGIGAGGMLGLLLLGLGISLAVVHRRHSAAGRHPATTA
jgi:hypothetical protein